MFDYCKHEIYQVRAVQGHSTFAVDPELMGRVRVTGEMQKILFHATDKAWKNIVKVGLIPGYGPGKRLENYFSMFHPRTPPNRPRSVYDRRPGQVRYEPYPGRHKGKDYIVAIDVKKAIEIAGCEFWQTASNAVVTNTPI